MTNSFQADTKYCPCCRDYVRYLASIDRSWCIECGGETRLFSDEDWAAFKAKMEARKPKGGRPRKSGGRRAATAAKATSAPKAKGSAA